MRQFFLKARTAWKFRSITAGILKLRAVERLNGLLVSAGLRRTPFTLPSAVVIRITERCFLKCRMCGQNGEFGRLRDKSMKDRILVSREIHDKIADEVSGWRIKPFMKYTGGEPLIEWNAIEPGIIKMVRSGCVIKINSNGVMLKNMTLAEKVVKSGIHYLSISVDGDEEIHNRIRGLPNVFRDIETGISNVIEARRKLGGRYPMILVSCVVSTLNEKRIGCLAELAGKWKIDWLNIQYLNYLTPARTGESHRIISEKFGISDKPWSGFEIADLTKVDCEGLSETIRKIMLRSPCPVSTMHIGGVNPHAIRRYHYTDDVIRKEICHMPFTTAFIIPPDRMTFCIDYPFCHYADLKDSSLSDGWFGEAAAKFRLGLLSHYRKTDRNFPHCMRCNWPYN